MKEFVAKLTTKLASASKKTIITATLLICAVSVCVVVLVLSPREEDPVHKMSGEELDKQVGATAFESEPSTQQGSESTTQADEKITQSTATTLAQIEASKDTEAPILITGSVVNVKLGAEKVPAPMICVDNLDRNVESSVEGSYDLNKVGEYSLVRVAKDKAGNETRFPFTLRVMEALPDSETETASPTIDISEIFTSHSTGSISFGVDVSKWQETINWTAVKRSGIDFAMIRLGVQKGFNGEPTLDTFFLSNYQGAKAAGLKVGVYFYSYATNEVEAKSQADFVLSVLRENECTLDLPIAYDWESWSKLSNLNMNIIDLNNCAKVFLDTVKDGGYQGMLYASKYYLEKELWRLPSDTYPVWLAHYTNTKGTTYQGTYKMWQCSCVGLVPGINGGVDIDILYN